MSRPRPAAIAIVVRISSSITLLPACCSLRAASAAHKRRRPSRCARRPRLVPPARRPHAGTMDIALPPSEPTPHTVRRDRMRVGYALLGAAGLVVGIWLAWLGAWLL